MYIFFSLFRLSLVRLKARDTKLDDLTNGVLYIRFLSRTDGKSCEQNVGKMSSIYIKNRFLKQKKCSKKWFGGLLYIASR
jgi:hypothetical protein